MGDSKKRMDMGADFCNRKLRNASKEQERKEAVKELHQGIFTGSDDLDCLLWQAVIAYQDYEFYTASGLPFSYTVKQGRDGSYSGELMVSRKEGSKTLTRSSVLLAFHKVLKNMKCVEQREDNREYHMVLIPAEYKGPKAIGQIFGVSYVYSLFWEFGLIKVPEKVGERMREYGGIREEG